MPLSLYTDVHIPRKLGVCPYFLSPYFLSHKTSISGSESSSRLSTTHFASAALNGILAFIPNGGDDSNHILNSRCPYFPAIDISDN